MDVWLPVRPGADGSDHGRAPSHLQEGRLAVGQPPTAPCWLLVFGRRFPGAGSVASSRTSYPSASNSPPAPRPLATRGLPTDNQELQTTSLQCIAHRLYLQRG